MEILRKSFFSSFHFFLPFLVNESSNIFPHFTFVPFLRQHTQKISFVTDRRKYRFSFSPFATIATFEKRKKERSKEIAGNKKTKNFSFFFFVDFDELRWCVLIHFDMKC